MLLKSLSLVLVVCVATACSKTPTSPSDIDPGRRFEGVTISALDSSPAAGLSVQVGTAQPVTSDASGRFTAQVAGPGSYRATVTGNAVVERHTTVTGPTSAPARLALIPSSFDLRAFDELFRTSHARLQRWTTRPSLVVLASVMNYRGDAIEYSATAERMTDEEVALLVNHLTEGLALWTAGTYTSFANVTIERPASGVRVSTAREQTIVVGRYNGIVSMAQTIGYGRWAEADDGAVVAGAMFLDSDFDRTDGRRRLLRIHELGHALGLTHVESRTSIMNPAIGPEPTQFDRQSAAIAFQRPPGNVAPDTDPGAVRGAIFGVRWAPPIGCTSGP